MDENVSEFSVDGEEVEFVTTSMVTLPSSEFPRRISEDDENENEGEGGDSEDEEGDDKTSEETPRAQNIQEQPFLPDKQNIQEQPLFTERSSFGKSSSNIPLVLGSASVETLAGPDGIPYRSSMSLPTVNMNTDPSIQFGLEAKSGRKKAIQSLPLPTYEMKLERLHKVEKFDAFSEDEEPVLKKDYQPVEREPKSSELDIREENIIVYNVRKDGVPQFQKLPRWDMNNSGGDQRTSGSSSLHHVVISSVNHLGGKPSSSQRVHTPHGGGPSITCGSVRAFGRQSAIRKKSHSRNDKGSCGTLNENFNDTTPHQRDLFFVSYEELSPKEVAVIQGLWKCITFDLWTFGVLTTINLFKLRGHITAKDPKATPDVMTECRFLWPHANHVMKALESVVMNLSRPSVSHKLVYEVGRKHWKLKIPITEEQTLLCINAFMYTFADHVHPRPNLNEMRTMRKFCSITMFLLADASRWDSEPAIPF